MLRVLNVFWRLWCASSNECVFTLVAGLLYTGWGTYSWGTSGIKQEDCGSFSCCTGKNHIEGMWVCLSWTHSWLIFWWFLFFAGFFCGGSQRRSKFNKQYNCTGNQVSAYSCRTFYVSLSDDQMADIRYMYFGLGLN